MAKKLKALASSVTDNQLTSTIKESTQQIWLAGLGAYAKAQEEGGKIFEALVQEGEALQTRTRQSADEKIAAMTDKTAGTWGRLEQVFEDRVARAVASLGIPTRKDIDKLSKRMAELTEVVQQLIDAQDLDDVAPADEAKPAAAAKKPVAAKKPPVKKAAAPIAKVKEEVKALATEVENVAKEVKEKSETTLF
ncbi:phasin family protein [Aeromonas hydrophila]|uniref:PhaF n=1 Tax=Aeromonas hydrophila subsp. hydrophila (strain ATCC 7966 / DSM 30187 / BCRC 13018 / CCUG 14551 / JCM 1027 / KCTC 2358 / NCIMB 9240 / NCTC 8049) TaxID=380703 RepID=A0KKJ6_AERHH|nr:phasin family protein [Aeromonas hydrophila]ABK36562.1 PhaF [Aeromonas hydrophila subsp. hydrophila ATCC 7966]MBL0568958.1 phasin family protein [Aeromonas hydrophila]MBS4671476.1 phasin family protein [Aeromonas hydrophila]MDF5705093.1 phasin family protein [Aeromonas hydrophila subsp. hydrophila]OOD29355.1 phosphohistidine phosphatase [Aeromonas hydrophila]